MPLPEFPHHLEITWRLDRFKVLQTRFPLMYLVVTELKTMTRWIKISVTHITTWFPLPHRMMGIIYHKSANFRNQFSNLYNLRLPQDQHSDKEMRYLMDSETDLDLRLMHLASSDKPLFSERLGWYCDDQCRTISKSNRALERFHHQPKSALMAHLPESWLDILPLVLRRIWTSYKDDVDTSAAELVYRMALKLPAEFFSSSLSIASAPEFLQSFRSYVRSVNITILGGLSSALVHQIEFQFIMAAIPSKSSKFLTVIAALSSNFPSCVTDIYEIPPADEGYYKTYFCS
ncbi:uncharacterized protein NPIL_530471 [Nephila pilipes]|uniref:Uncharacterized protein n=1 Tax=Nephila pilipes TaxID=299642 RepID=A0A8X6PK00_NEPPI|nr:uncharacterized protein NPIL_34851 [Nephila pilipes]GFU36261.1 uncharacterized protein NPIL_530471 [Nephila pilipes]